MSLVDFMQELQTQDIVYSQPPQPSIQVIPPEKAVTTVIPPEPIAEEVKKPTVIKLKIRQMNVSVNTAPTAVESKPIEEKNTVTPQPPTQAESSPQPPPQEVVQTEKTAEPVVDEPMPTPTPVQPAPAPVVDATPPKSEEDRLFEASGTEISRKPRWIEIYRKALASRKVGYPVDRIRMGKFFITEDNKTLMLPDKNVVGRDPDVILREQWLSNDDNQE